MTQMSQSARNYMQKKGLINLNNIISSITPKANLVTQAAAPNIPAVTEILDNCNSPDFVRPPADGS